ncbi:MAG: HDIG domain-containing protein [Anaerolineales bacterium]|nr:HDIG domain-containing protein [Anaerolineales bacterium]
MATNSNQRTPRWPNRRTVFLTFLFIVSVGLVFTILLFPLYTQATAPQLEIGEVASEETLAPYNISYISEIRTDQQRYAAFGNVPSIYTPPNTSVARRQLERIRGTLAYITSVRADEHASIDQKAADLAALEDFTLSEETALNILSLSDARWQAVQQEAIVVLEQVMRNTIREDRVDNALRSVPALVSLDLPEDQAAIVAELVSGFVAPNSFYSEELTEAARDQAQEAIEPSTHSYVQGETVIPRGKVVTSTDLEALEQFGLIQPDIRWQDIVSTASLVLLMTILLLLYIRQKPSLLHDVRGLTLIIVLFLIFLVSGRLIIEGHIVLPYIFPLTAFSLVIAALFGAETAIIFTIPLAILYAYKLPNAIDVTLYFLLSGICGALALGRAQRVTSFFWSGVAIAVVGAAVIVAYRLSLPTTDITGLGTLMGVALLNGVISPTLALFLQFFLAQFLGMTTALQLMEISRPDHKLLQHLLRNAPGTYQHSLQVANLAEQAADQIGADTLLTRVGALYHDVGKTVNPAYFIENQVIGSPNPHDNLDPEISAEIIIRHVTDGLELSRNYRLPRRIQDFIAEHHGTMLTRYQYVKAVESAGGDKSKVDKYMFRYPGPRPQSRETAILMLADGCEARLRAERPDGKDELRNVIKEVVDNRLSSEQLDNTDLTLRDLDDIIESFTTTLRGIYHPRIEYPKLEQQEQPIFDPTPTRPSLPQTTSDVSVEPQTDS